jgi:DNA transposition AAA+ family ATPase
MNSIPSARKQIGFLVTKEYRQYGEFCDECRKYGFIGLCHGEAGVGKTESGRYYAHWDEVSSVIAPYLRPSRLSLDKLAQWASTVGTASIKTLESRTIYYKPPRSGNPNIVAADIYTLVESFNTLITLFGGSGKVELIIVDEADWLKMQGLEELRSIHDDLGVAIIFIGMPGIEKRFSRYAQLHSRVGFVHTYRPLTVEELQFTLTHKWQQLGLALNPTEFADAEAIAVIYHYTGGNFRKVDHLFDQIENIVQINNLHAITKEVVEKAAQNLSGDSR